MSVYAITTQTLPTCVDPTGHNLPCMMVISILPPPPNPLQCQESSSQILACSYATQYLSNGEQIVVITVYVPANFVFSSPAVIKVIVHETTTTSTTGGDTGGSKTLPHKLLVAIGIAKDPIVRGNIQTITVTVSDSKKPSMKIAGARVSGEVDYYSGGTTKTFYGTTNDAGQMVPSYSWKIGPDSKNGTFTVTVQASATGYVAGSKTTAFKVISKTAPLQTPTPSPTTGLSVAIAVAKNPIIRGNIQTISVGVSDDTDKSKKIGGADVNGEVTYVTGHQEPLTGLTNGQGIYSHPWRISGDAAPGKFKVDAQASVDGKSGSATTTFTVIPKTNTTIAPINMTKVNMTVAASGGKGTGQTCIDNCTTGTPTPPVICKTNPNDPSCPPILQPLTPPTSPSTQSCPDGSVIDASASCPTQSTPPPTNNNPPTPPSDNNNPPSTDNNPPSGNDHSDHNKDGGGSSGGASSPSNPSSLPSP